MIINNHTIGKRAAHQFLTNNYQLLLFIIIFDN
jgi:hypothetical protein